MNPKLRIVAMASGIIVGLVVVTSITYWFLSNRHESATETPVLTNSQENPSLSPAVSVPASPSVLSSTPEAAGTCSPRGTGTCDGNGRPLVEGQGADGGASDSTLITAEQAGVKTIKLSGLGPQGLDIDPDSGLIYVGNNGWSTCRDPKSGSGDGSTGLSIADPSLGIETARVASAGSPIWPLTDVKRNVVYVAGSGGVFAIHQRLTGEKLKTIELGPSPHAVGVSTDGTIVVSNTKDGSHKYYAVLNADSQEFISHQMGPEFPHSIVYDQDKNVFYMIGVEDGKIGVIDGKTGAVISTFSANKVDGNSAMMALATKTNKLYVTVSEPRPGVNVIDTDSYKIVGGFEYSTPATSIAIDESGNLLFMVVANKDAVEIYNATTYQSLGHIATGDCPFGVRVDPKRGIGAVTNQESNTLTIFDLAQLAQVLK